MKIYLDDIRLPYDDTWTLVKNMTEFQDLVDGTILIEEISFDHDLGETEPTGHAIAKWFVEYCMDHEGVANNLKRVIAHSDNPPGRENIAAYFESARVHEVFDGELIVERRPALINKNKG